jgi:hypothetical protein
MTRRKSALRIAAEVLVVLAVPLTLAADDPQPASVTPTPSLLLPPEPTPSAESPASEPADAFTPSPEFQEWITKLAREQLPDQYEKKKNWGHTAKSFDGLSVRLEDGQLKTHRKFKQANDGTWQMYRVTLKDPEEKFEVRIANLRTLASGRVAMDITAVANLEVFGRQSLWQHGVQIFSISAEADARVRLFAHTEVATRLDPTRFPPDVALEPEVKTARLDIPDFRLRRLGEFSGPLVRSLSHATREALEDKLRDDNEKLVAKLNKAIDKQEKKLRLSLADVMQSKWSGLLGAGQKSGE